MTKIPERAEAEFLVFLQRVSRDQAASSLEPPKFTAVVHAATMDEAVREAEKLAILFEGRFKVVDIQPAIRRQNE